MAEVMDAIERLRERAQNEATCIELSRQNKELRARVVRLEEALRVAENKLRHILYMED